MSKRRHTRQQPPRHAEVQTEQLEQRLLLASVYGPLDNFLAQPLPSEVAQGQQASFYNLVGSDRGVVGNPANVQWRDGSVRIERGNEPFTGIFEGLNHPVSEGIPLNLHAVHPRPMLPQYQSPVTHIRINIIDGIGPLKIELKDTQERLIWGDSVQLVGGQRDVLFGLPSSGLEDANLMVILMDGQDGDFIEINEISLRFDTPDLAGLEPFVWTYGNLLANYDPGTGLVRDRANFPSGAFDNVSATGTFALATALAAHLGIIPQNDAVAIIENVTSSILAIPDFMGVKPHFTTGGSNPTISPGTEYAYIDTILTYLPLMEARYLVGLDTEPLENAFQQINYDALMLENGLLSHGYTEAGGLLQSGWDIFGGETFLAVWAYAASRPGDPLEEIIAAVDGTPPTFNGSQFIDELSALFLVMPERDVWGVNWPAYLVQQAEAQFAYYEDLGLTIYGANAAEVAEPWEVPEDQIYQAFGIGGRIPANDGSALTGHIHAAPSALGMLHSRDQERVLASWEELKALGTISPLNVVESLYLTTAEGVTKAVWNPLKGGWNLALASVGYARGLMEAGFYGAYIASQGIPFIGHGLDRLAAPSESTAQLTISDAEDLEDSGELVFQISLDQPAADEISVEFSTSNETANAADFSPASGTANILKGATGTTITVSLTADQIVEADETFTITLSNPSSGAEVGVATAKGTIRNDDTAKLTLRSVDADQNEGSGTGTTTYTFSVSLDHAVDGGFNLSYTTIDETATVSDGDYVDNDGTLNFAGNAGEMQSIAVPVNHDDDVEASEFFTVALGAITGLGSGIVLESIALGDPASGTIRNDDQIVVSGAGAGGGPHVRVFNAARNLQEELHNFFAYASGFLGGVRVAAGDVNGDGAADIITGAGPGGGPHVRVFDGITGDEIASFFAFAPTFLGGVHLAAADFNGDERAEVIVAADAGGGPHVRVLDLSGSEPEELFSFFAYSSGFLGGVRVAAGDVNGDGTPDIITGAGAGGGPHVRVFNGIDETELQSFFAFAPGFLGGVFVSSADFNLDDRSDFVVAAGAGGGPHIRILSGANPDIVLASNFVYSDSFTGGVQVGVTSLAGDNIPDIVTGPGAGGTSLVVARYGAAGESVEELIFSPGFAGGVFVAGSLMPNVEPALPIDSGNSIPQNGVARLEVSQAEQMVGEAVRRREQASLAAVGSLSDVQLEVVDLPGDQLGRATGQTFFLDVDAAGFGWFIDPTPVDDREFQSRDPEVLGRVDLLSDVAHELGHVLEFEYDREPSFLAERLSLGTPPRIESNDFDTLDSVFANSATGIRLMERL